MDVHHSSVLSAITIKCWFVRPGALNEICSKHNEAQVTELADDCTNASGMDALWQNACASRVH